MLRFPFSDNLPAISETSFHIFIVMASRRLEADRFFTKDFTPEVC